jgi:hypothetical protein
MNESLLSITTDTSIASRETEINSSYESQTSKETDLKNHIINSISSSLKDIIKYNKSNEKNVQKDIFYLSFIPPISLEDFIKHLMKYSKMDISTLIISIIYIDIFCDKNQYILTENNIFRILLSVCLLSLKFNEDIIINYKSYAEIASVSVEDLKNLEFYMYLKLHFSLNIKYELYQSYYDYFSNYSNPGSEKNSK